MIMSQNGVNIKINFFNIYFSETIYDFKDLRERERERERGGGERGGERASTLVNLKCTLLYAWKHCLFLAMLMLKETSQFSPRPKEYSSSFRSTKTNYHLYSLPILNRIIHPILNFEVSATRNFTMDASWRLHCTSHLAVFNL